MRLITYLIQLGGFIAGGAALVLIFDNKLASGLLIFGAIAWWVGGYIRRQHLL